MSDSEATPSPTAAPSSARITFERLRERTDELELIISGLTTVALFSLPGWLLSVFAHWYPKLPLPVVAGAQNALMMTMGLSYLLATLFAVHLGVRAYWVGLIGLKSVFPEGIRWDRTTGLGPITRAELKSRLPGIDEAIDSADRRASILFAVITLGALTSLWAAGLLTVLFFVAAAIGNALGATNAALTWAMTGLVVVVIGSAIGIWLLDAVLAARFPALERSRLVRGTVGLLRRMVLLVLPERLITPVQLTLQSNTHPRLFTVLFVLAMILVPMIGIQQFQAFTSFDSLGGQRFITAADLPAWHSSRYYENQLTPRDRLRLGPMIPSPTVTGSWVPLFLPYFGLIDDPVLQRLCAGMKRPSGEACLRRIWKVELNGHVVPMDGFRLAQRHDLGFRGLLGYLPLEAAKPGPQLLVVTWNPEGTEANRADDYMPAKLVHRIPFLLAPEWDAPSASR